MTAQEQQCSQHLSALQAQEQRCDQNLKALLVIGHAIERIEHKLASIDRNIGLLVNDKREVHAEVGLLRQRIDRISDLFQRVVAPEGEPDPDPDPEPEPA